MFTHKLTKPKLLQQETKQKAKKQIPISIQTRLPELRFSLLGDCLKEALDKKDYELLDFLLTYAKPTSRQQSVCPQNLLNKAVKKGDERAVRCIVEKGHVDPQRIPDAHEYDALSLAVSHGHMQILKYFVEELKIDLRKPGKELAAMSESHGPEFIEYFKTNPVACGYNLVALALTGGKCFVGNGNFPVLKYLVEVGKAPLSCHSIFSRSLLDIYLEYLDFDHPKEGQFNQQEKAEQLDFIKYLVEHGFEVNPKLHHDPLPSELSVFRTPLATACMYRRLDFVKYLVAAKADVNQPEYGMLPIDIAAQHSSHKKGRSQIVEFLEPLTNRELGEARIAEAKQAEEKAMADTPDKAESESDDESDDSERSLRLLKELGIEPLPEFDEELTVGEALKESVDFKVALPFCVRTRFLCATIPDEINEQHISVSLKR